MQDCFEQKDIGLLQKVIAEMDPKEAEYHMKRCVDSGLLLSNSPMREGGRGVRGRERGSGREGRE